MLVTQTLWSRLEGGLESPRFRCTYKSPVKKIALTPIFFFVASWRSQTAGKGIAIMKRSLKTLIAAAIIVSRSEVLRQAGFASFTSHDSPGLGTQTIAELTMLYMHCARLIRMAMYVRVLVSLRTPKTRR